MRMMAGAMLAVLLGAVPTARAANLIKDGGFEKPPTATGSYIVYNTGQTFEQWTVVGASGNVATVSGTFTQNGYSFPAKSGKAWLDLTGVLGAEFTLVNSNAIPLCILNRFVEFTVFFSAMKCEWIGDGLRKFWGTGRWAGIADIEDEENRSLGLQDRDGPRAGMNRAPVMLTPAFGRGNVGSSWHLGVNQHRIEW